MLKFLHKFIKFLIVFFKKEVYLNFKNPKFSSIMLVDDIAEKYLYNSILNNFDYISISTRPDSLSGKFYISFKMIFYFLNGLSKKLNIKSSYIYACIKCVKPKIVIDNINDHNLVLIAKLFPKIQFIFLPQGTWFRLKKKGRELLKYSFFSKLSSLDIKKLSNLTIFLWGDKDVELLKEEGLDIKKSEINIIKIGSWQGSYYNDIHIPSEKKYDLLFISQLHNLFIESNSEWHKQILNNTVTSVKLISEYASEKNLSVGYICRSKIDNDQKEIEIISSLNNITCKFEIIKHADINTIWKEIFRSKIILSNDSTGAHDAIALYKKVVLMPLNNTEVFRWSSLKYKNDKDFWPWTIENNEHDEFKKILDNLLNFELDAYKKSIEDRVEYMCYSKNKLPSYKNIIEFIKHRL